MLGTQNLLQSQTRLTASSNFLNFEPNPSNAAIGGKEIKRKYAIRKNSK